MGFSAGDREGSCLPIPQDAVVLDDLGQRFTVLSATKGREPIVTEPTPEKIDYGRIRFSIIF